MVDVLSHVTALGQEDWQDVKVHFLLARNIDWMGKSWRRTDTLTIEDPATLEIEEFTSVV